jgi:drug/metabolite transporter (DMT)-like permease
MSVLWMLISALLFSMMGASIKLAAIQYSTAEILFYRSLVGVIIIGLYMYSRRESIRPPLLDDAFKSQYRRCTDHVSLVCGFCFFTGRNGNDLKLHLTDLDGTDLSHRTHHPQTA